MNSWYVVRTQANAESTAVENFSRQGCAVYLPPRRCWRVHARRREVVLRPLFPRYLFVGFDGERTRWRPIVSTVGVATLICRGETPVQVPHGLIEGVRASEGSGYFDDAGIVARLQPGASVLITTGPFAALTCQFQSFVSASRVSVLLRLLGQYVPTIVGLEQVAPA